MMSHFGSLHSCTGARRRRAEDVQIEGNVIDPLDVMHEYGTDAFRFTLTAMAAMGRDIKRLKIRLPATKISLISSGMRRGLFL